MTLLFLTAGVLVLSLVCLRLRLLPGNWAALLPALLLVHAVADATTKYFPPGTLNPGSARVALGTAVVAAASYRAYRRGPMAVLLVFLAYFLVHASLTSNPSYSLEVWLKVFLPVVMMCFGAGWVRDLSDLRRANLFFLAGMGVIVGQLVLAQLFGLGQSAYVENSLFMGGGQIQTSYYLVVGAVLMPLLIAASKRRWERLAIWGVTALSLLITLLLLRRGALAGLSVGLLVYLVVARNKGRAMIGISAMVFIALLTLPLYQDLLIQRIDARELTERRLEDEMRYRETFYVTSDLGKSSAAVVMFGKEAFNSPNYFRSLMYGRQLHVDYNVLLHGGGVVGLWLFLSVFGWLAIALWRVKPSTHVGERLRACALALIAASVVISLSGSLAVQSYWSALAFYVGAAYRYVVIDRN